jgi:hypothetical protein
MARSSGTREKLTVFRIGMPLSTTAAMIVSAAAGVSSTALASWRECRPGVWTCQAESYAKRSWGPCPGPSCAVISDVVPIIGGAARSHLSD